MGQIGRGLRSAETAPTDLTTGDNSWRKDMNIMAAARKNVATQRDGGGSAYGTRNPAGATQTSPLGAFVDYSGRYQAKPPMTPVARTGTGAPATGADNGAQGAAVPETPGPEKATSPYGSQSGPGILENWFNQRATGIDAASQYAQKRGLDALGDRFSASGGYNSGAARQADADLIANVEAQRAAQLDSLAGGASGERQGRLNAMFNQGIGLAGGQAGTMGQYDTASAGANNSLMQALISIMANKAGVDAKANQGFFSNLIGGASLL